MPHVYPGKENFFCRGKMHFVRHSYRSLDALGFTVYDLYPNCLLSGLPDIDFDRAILFLVNDNEIYALVSEKQAVKYRTGDVTGEERKKCVSFIIK